MILLVGGPRPFASATAAAATIAPPSIASAGATEPCGTLGSPTTTVYLPNITKTLGGPSGWVTPFIVQNIGAQPTVLEVSFFRFADGSLVTCRKVSGLAPGTSFADVPNNDTDLPSDTQFSVVVRSYGAQVVSVVNEHQGLGTPARAEALSYVGLTTGATRIGLPFVAKQVGGWLTTFVTQNLGAALANVTATFSSADGTKTATLTRQIGPGRSQFVDPTVEPSLLAGTEYAVVLTSDQPIAVIANAHNDLPTVAAPMGFSYNGVPARSSAPVYLPLMSRNTDGIGRTSRLLIENLAAADAAPILSFQRLGVSGTTTLAAPQLKPGRAWSFDPRFAVDGQKKATPMKTPATISGINWPEGSVRIAGLLRT